MDPLAKTKLETLADHATILLNRFQRLSGDVNTSSDASRGLSNNSGVPTDDFKTF
jgi:hypothetical protein